MEYFFLPFIQLFPFRFHCYHSSPFNNFFFLLNITFKADIFTEESIHLWVTNDHIKYWQIDRNSPFAGPSGIERLIDWLDRKKLEKKHWIEMIENPRRPIIHWHVLKVNQTKYSHKQCCGSGSGSGRIRSFLVTRIRIRIWENTGSGSGSFIHKKTPCYSNFLVIKLYKIQFRPKNFLSLILSSIIIFYL